MRERVVIVHLRRPRLNDPRDSRKDPFWEFGSFGLTGCHSRNLMHPKNAAELSGARLAFIQGGNGEMRIVYLSPPVTTVVHKNVVEARWEPSMPFCFVSAPLVVNNLGATIFPSLKKTFSKVNRDTWARKCSSMYRSRSTPLPEDVAREVIETFNVAYSDSTGRLVETYEQALPFQPSLVDRDRIRTYRELLSKAKF